MLNKWRSLQIRFGLAFLLEELDYKLSDCNSFNELRSSLRSHFGADVKGKQYQISRFSDIWLHSILDIWSKFPKSYKWFVLL